MGQSKEASLYRIRLNALTWNKQRRELLKRLYKTRITLRFLRDFCGKAQSFLPTTRGCGSEEYFN